MVLEEASSSQEASSSFSDEALPTSDVDRYATSNPHYTATRELSYIEIPQPGGSNLYVNIHNLPQPLNSFFLPFPRPEVFKKGIQDACKEAAAVVQRPLTQEEADAFAFHFAKSVRLGMFGLPVGAALGAFQSYRTRDSFRFPGWSPMKSGRFSPDVFGPLRGEMARSAWHGVRTGFYFFPATFLSLIFFGMYATNIRAIGTVTDPRLREYVEAYRRRNSNRAVVDTSEGRKEGETFEMARQRTRTQREQQQAAKGAQVDDMSPTSGAFGENYGQARSDTAMMDDSQARQYDYGRAQEGTQIGIDSTTPSTKQPSRTSASGTSSQSSQQSSKASGSAWERLRQNAMSGNPAPSTQSQPSRTAPREASQPKGASGDNSFSFAQSDEDKQLARIEAQKEFDTRIEREREGKDFDEGRGKRGKW